MKKEREISYNEIKDGEFFYMPVNVYDIRFILANTNVKKTKIIFYSWYGGYREFTNLLLSYNSPVKKAFDSSYNRMFLFQKIKGPFIIEPNTNAIFTLEGDILNTINNLDLNNEIDYSEAKNHMDFFENNPVAIECGEKQKFYSYNEENEDEITNLEELKDIIDYIITLAKKETEYSYILAKETEEQKAKRYIKFIQNNI